MKWRIENDDTEALITAERHVDGEREKYGDIVLPEAGVIFEMSAALPYIMSNYECFDEKKLPCFLTGPSFVMMRDMPGVCFVRGGFGAPAAADTLETVRALGVKRVIIAGMCGGFGGGVRVGDIIIPRYVRSEEGTSFHYVPDAEISHPDARLYDAAVRFFDKGCGVCTSPIVTTDAVYRQTFAKEAAWREAGYVGVDMETSALLNVAKYYGMPAVAIHICSDRHPEAPGGDVWKWGSTDFREQRRSFFDDVVRFAAEIAE